jgi:hypothetical protein
LINNIKIDTMKTYTHTYKLNWTTDDTNNLYQRDVRIDAIFDEDEKEATVTIFVDNNEDAEDENTWFAETESDLDQLVEDYVSDSLSWLTECEDRFIIGTTKRGDFCSLDLVK